MKILLSIKHNKEVIRWCWDYETRGTKLEKEEDMEISYKNQRFYLEVCLTLWRIKREDMKFLLLIFNLLVPVSTITERIYFAPDGWRIEILDIVRSILIKNTRLLCKQEGSRKEEDNE